MKKLVCGIMVVTGWLAGINSALSGDSGQAVATKAKTIMARVRFLNDAGVLREPAEVPKVTKTDEQWRQQLTAEQYRIARRKGTEPAFCGVFYDHKKPGTYFCVCCGLPLFSADAKFDSGTGWPSFFRPVAPENVATHLDISLGMRRTEILCALCDAHLGHVFEDGPPPTGLRYCLNSESLVFKEKATAATNPHPATP
jgi:methionine-R-sulfoxide reductase